MNLARNCARTLTLVAIVGAPLGAQTAPNHATSTIRAVWQPIAKYIAQSAEDMPEAKYSFRPSPDVRTFGELIGHVAGSQYMFCAAATGDASRGEDDVEKTAKTKADLVAAMKASTAYCAKAYAQADAATQASIMLFNQKQNRLWALVMNTSHDDEHYGNIVTYLRMNGIVPPSSRPSTP